MANVSPKRVPVSPVTANQNHLRASVGNAMQIKIPMENWIVANVRSQESVRLAQTPILRVGSLVCVTQMQLEQSVPLVAPMVLQNAVMGSVPVVS